MPSDPSAVDAPHVPSSKSCSHAELEERLLRALERPEAEHVSAVAALAAQHPEHGSTLWRWLAEVRCASATRASLARPMDGSPPPSRLGPYLLGERLGQGGMGTVYAATHAETGAEVALKVIRADLVEHAEARERFRRELAALQRVRHPSLCPVLDLGEFEGAPYFAMPRLRGEDLARKVARARRAFGNGPVVLADEASALPDLLAFFEAAARGLDAAHRAGLIHRDVKPGNLFCTDQGTPVLLDFGLARDTRAEHTTLAGSRELLGTLEYMPPEQVRGARALDARADVYALAASLYEALILAPPLRGRSRSETLERILHTDALPLVKLRPELPRSLSVLLARALEKDPRRRPRDAGAFADELARVRRGERLSLREDGPARHLWRWCRRYPIAAGALALTSLFSLAAAALISSREEALARERRAHARAAEALEKFRLTEHAVHLANARVAQRALPPLTDPHACAAYEDWLARFAAPLRSAAPALGAQRDALAAYGAPAADERARADELAALRAELATFEARCATLRPDEEEVDRLWSELGALQRRAIEASLAELESGGARLRVRFAGDGAQQFLFGELERLCGELARFERDERAGISAVERRLALAREVHAPLAEHLRLAWERAREELRSDPRFGGIELRPDPGLRPLGRDPRSGLQEFACAFSGVAPARRDGSLAIDGASAIVFVLLPGGRARLGSQRRDPAGERYDAYSPADMGPHEVELAPYYCAKHELGQGQWKRLAGGANPSYVRPGNVPRDQPTGDEFPVESVSWIDARELLRCYGMDLPTEAQWELAARAGSDAVFPWGDAAEALEGRANLFGREMLGLPANLPGGPAPFDDGAKLPLPIAALEPNAYGLHHVIGNVAEWCRDAFWTWRTPFAPGDGAIDFPLARYRSYRGASYLDGWLNARVSARRKALPEAQQASLGIRPARTLRLDGRPATKP